MKNEEEIKAQAVQLEAAVQEWFRQHRSVRAVYARELGDYLVKKKLLKKRVNPHTALYYFLKNLWEKGKLNMVPSARLYGTSWIFARTEQDEPPKKETAKTAAMRKFGIKE